MPWLETSPVEQRERFIADDRRGLYTGAELCARYGTGRETGYKWLARYHEDGRRGLKDRSHAPHHCPHRIDREVADLLVGARRQHPDWGPRKLLDWLGPRHPTLAEAEENGAHERMHRTLKAGACRPPRAHLAAQQRTFTRFRALYNEERPHEYLGGRTPSSRYAPSPRPYPERLPPIEYPGHFIVKRITNAGTFRLKHKLLFLANPLKQQLIGLEETDDGVWSIHFATVLLGKVDERDMVIRD